MCEAEMIVHMVQGSFDLWTKVWGNRPESFKLYSQYRATPGGWHTKLAK